MRVVPTSNGRRPVRCVFAAITVWALFGAVPWVTGCTYYQVAPGTYSTVAANKFDRSWNAVVAAFTDQGVNVDREDRESGTIRGSKGGIAISANVRTLADGSVRVQFDTTGDTASDPQLIDRVSRAYDRNMGR